MKTNIRIANINDKNAWNTVVITGENGTFFHTWEWMEVINKGLCESTYPLVAEKDGTIVGIFPAFSRTILNSVKAMSKVYWLDKFLPLISRNFKILWSPYPNTWGYGGPCVVAEDDSARMLLYNKLYDKMHSVCKTERSIVDFRISPLNCDSIDRVILNENQYTTNERRTSIIDLTLNEDVLWKNLRKDSHRNAINQARRKGVIIREAKRKADFIEFYKLVKDLENRTGILADPISYYMHIYEILVHNGMAKLFLAERDNTILGGLINFYYKDMVFLGHMSFLREYSGFRANNLVIWHSIIESKNSGFKLIDLTGMPHDENNGIYIFKSGFGGSIKNLKWYRKKIRFIRTRDSLKRLAAIKIIGI